MQLKQEEKHNTSKISDSPSQQNMLPLEKVQSIHTIKQFVRLHNNSAEGNSAGLISAISAVHLKKLINNRHKLTTLLSSADLTPETFSLLLQKMTINHLKKIIKIHDQLFSWMDLLNDIPPHLRATLLCDTNGLLEEVTTCKNLGDILGTLDENDHQRLYTNPGLNLRKIVSDYDALRYIQNQFLPMLFQQLGYEYIASLIEDGPYLLQALANIPKQDRLSFLKLVGLDKLRAYINTEEKAELLFKKMPIETHPLLKQTLYLFETTVCLKSEQPKLMPKPPKRALRLAKSKTEDCKLICNPISLGDNDVIGIGIFDHQPPSLLVYDTLAGNIKVQCDDYKDLILLDKKKRTFIAPKWHTNRYDKLVWEDKTLYHTNSAFVRNPAHYNCMIPLRDGTWMILSEEVNNIVNNYKSWSISILEPSTFKISRELNVDRSHYAYVNYLTLLPDGKTVLAWDKHSLVKSQPESCCSTAYTICLINISDFSMQSITLPINPQLVSGKISQINVQGKEIEIEITLHNYSHIKREKEKVYYSFEFNLLADEGKSRNREHDAIVTKFRFLFHRVGIPCLPILSKTPSLKDY